MSIASSPLGRLSRRTGRGRAIALLVLGAAACKSSSTTPEAPRCGLLTAVNGVHFRTDEWVASVAVGDLDEDGRPDVLAASGRGDVVTVLRGNGDGTFERGASFATGAGPSWGVALADLDGDRHLDAVVGNGGTVSVSVLRGNGDGTFQPKADFATGASPVWVAIRDVNGDGRPDVVTADRNDHTVSVLVGAGDGSLGAPARLGVGDGTFTPGAATATGAGAYRIALDDLDGDGKLDLAVANLGDVTPGSRTVTVLLGRGDGTFAPKSDYVLSQKPVAIAIADVDGDGRKDLACATTEGGVAVLPGAGGGAFGAASAHRAGVFFPRGAATADLDGDGRPDFLVLNFRHPADPPFAPGALPEVASGALSELGAGFSVGALVNRCQPSLTVTPLRVLAIRGEAPTTFSATLGGQPQDVAWTLSAPAGTLSRSSGPTVEYTPPASAGPLEEVWLTASTGSASVRTSIQISPIQARPLGTTTAPNGFLEHLPPGYGDGQPRPLLVSLHGSAGEGDGTTELARVTLTSPEAGLIAVGQWPAARPMIVLAPQQHPRGGNCFAANEVRDFLAWAIASYDVDPSRAFLTGFSCGSMAAWDYLSWYSDTQIAAAALYAGDPGMAWQRAGCYLGHVALWVFHGDQDSVVRFEPEATVMDQLSTCPGIRPYAYTLVPGAGHGIPFPVLDGAYGYDVIGWLLANPKP